MSKGILGYRAFEFERVQQEIERQREQQHSMLMGPSSSEGEAVDSGAVFLSFPYRNNSNDNGIPTDPWINYYDDTTDLPEKASTTSKTRTSPDPNDIDAWSEELEKRLLASPTIRDLDDFDLEDMEELEDEYGYYDDEDEDGYSSSGSSSDICDSDESDDGRVVGSEDAVQDGKKKEEGKVYGKVLMSFWEDDDVDCISVEEIQEAERREEEDWVKDMRVVEVAVQA